MGNLPSAAGPARLNINQASRDDLASIPGVGHERAQALIEARPFSQWSDLERAAGVDPTLIAKLQGEGAELGAPSQGPNPDLGVGAQPSRTIGRTRPE